MHHLLLATTITLQYEGFTLQNHALAPALAPWILAGISIILNKLFITCSPYIVGGFKSELDL